MDETLDPKHGLSKSTTEDPHFQEAVDLALSRGLRLGTPEFQSAVIEHVWKHPYQPPKQPVPAFLLEKADKTQPTRSHGNIAHIADKTFETEPEITDEQLDEIRDELSKL